MITSLFAASVLAHYVALSRVVAPDEESTRTDRYLEFA